MLGHVQLFCDPPPCPWIIAQQDPLSTGFPGQEHKIGLPFPSPEDLFSPGIEPVSPALVGSFSTKEPLRRPQALNTSGSKFRKILIGKPFGKQLDD